MRGDEDAARFQRRVATLGTVQLINDLNGFASFSATRTIKIGLFFFSRTVSFKHSVKKSHYRRAFPTDRRAQAASLMSPGVGGAGTQRFRAVLPFLSRAVWRPVFAGAV